MRHVPDGVLRRLDDEPLAIPDRVTEHLAGCSRCTARRQEIAADTERVARLLTVAAPQPVADPELAWVRLRRELPRMDRPPATPAGRPGRTTQRPRRPHLPRLSLRAALAAGATAALIAATAAAATLTTIFDPTHVAPVALNRGDLQAIGDLVGLDGGQALGGLNGPAGSIRLRVGRLSWTSNQTGHPVASLSQADAESGLSVRLPTRLPSGVTSTPRFAVQPRLTATVTFNPAASPSLAGTSVTLHAGPGVLAAYPGSIGRVPVLGIATMPRPTADSTGAGLSQIEAYLLDQPGIPPGLAEEIRLLGDVRTVLPVPVPAGAAARSVRIGGWPGVLLSDASHAGAAVVWEDSAGLVHAVVGLLDPQDVLDVARQVG